MTTTVLGRVPGYVELNGTTVLARENVAITVKAGWSYSVTDGFTVSMYDVIANHKYLADLLPAQARALAAALLAAADEADATNAGMNDDHLIQSL